MICRGNILLILDADVMIKILETAEGNVAERIITWLRSSLRHAPRNISGKSVTILASKNILCDYKSGFYKTDNGPLYRALEILFDKGWSQRRVQSSRGTIHLMVYLINDSQSLDRNLERRMKQMDKFDRKYVLALRKSISLNHLIDRQVLFVSEDDTCLRGMTECLVDLRNGRRIETSTWSEITDKLGNH